MNPIGNYYKPLVSLRSSAFKKSVLPTVPEGMGLSSLIDVFDNIGDFTGYMVGIQHSDNLRDLISVFDGQFNVSLFVKKRDAVFF